MKCWAQTDRCISSVRYVMRLDVRYTYTPLVYVLVCVRGFLSSISWANKSREYTWRDFLGFFLSLGLFVSFHFGFFSMDIELRLMCSLNIVSPSRMLKLINWLVYFVGGHFQCRQKWHNEMTVIDDRHGWWDGNRFVSFRFIMIIFWYFFILYLSLFIIVFYLGEKLISIFAWIKRWPLWNSLILYVVLLFCSELFTKSNVSTISLYTYDAHTKTERKEKKKKWKCVDNERRKETATMAKLKVFDGSLPACISLAFNSHTNCMNHSHLHCALT